MQFLSRQLEPVELNAQIMLRWLTRELVGSKVHKVLLGARNLEMVADGGRRTAGSKIELPGGESGVDMISGIGWVSK